MVGQIKEEFSVLFSKDSVEILFEENIEYDDFDLGLGNSTVDVVEVEEKDYLACIDPKASTSKLEEFHEDEDHVHHSFHCDSNNVTSGGKHISIFFRGNKSFKLKYILSLAIVICAVITVTVIVLSQNPSNEPTKVAQQSKDLKSAPTLNPSTVEKIDFDQNTNFPTVHPLSGSKTQIPSFSKFSTPTFHPSSGRITSIPSIQNSENPTLFPSSNPSRQKVISVPSSSPSNEPTLQPSLTQMTSEPSGSPSNIPSGSPSNKPTLQPSLTPTTSIPSNSPSNEPSLNPTFTPTTTIPSNFPSDEPTPQPSNSPSDEPTPQPSHPPSTTLPSQSPSDYPSPSPSFIPSSSPSSSNVPTHAPSMSRSPSSAPSYKRPNILLILADDLGTGDLPFYWTGKKSRRSLVETPNLEKFANEGVLFQDAHSTPLCAPSRYSILSGNYPHRGTNIFGSWGFQDKGNQFLEGQSSIAQLLHSQAGYETGVFGKWHIGGKIPPKGFSDSNGKSNILTAEGHDWSQPFIGGPSSIGFEHSYVSMGGIQEPPYSFFRNGLLTTNITDVRYWNRGLYSMPHGISQIGYDSVGNGEGDKSWDSSAYDLIVLNETKAFIENHIEVKPNDPFFAYVALTNVHKPHTPPYFFPDGTRVSETQQTQHLDTISLTDKIVGSLVNLIEEKQLSEDTIIIFTSDNGGLQDSDKVGHETSGPLRGSKGSVYEGGHTVPLIVRWNNNLPSGETRSRLVGLNDLFATICDLVGLQIPFGSGLDSVSFSRYLKDNSRKENLRKYLGIFNVRGSKTNWQMAIREGKKKLVYYPDRVEQSYEFYDLKDDLSERNNLANVETASTNIVQMFEKLKSIGPCANSKYAKICSQFHWTLS